MTESLLVPRLLTDQEEVIPHAGVLELPVLPAVAVYLLPLKLTSKAIAIVVSFGSARVVLLNMFPFLVS